MTVLSGRMALDYTLKARRLMDAGDLDGARQVLTIMELSARLAAALEKPAANTDAEKLEVYT